MSNNLQLKRGLQSALPIGLSGELLFTTDTKRLYLSDGSANNLLQGSDSIFTTGSIPFSNSSGKLTTDSSNLYWDDTNNRLGIGTNAPAAKTSIVSTTALTGLYVENLGSATSPSAIFKNNQNTSYASIDILGGSLITNSNKFQFGQYSSGDSFFYLVGNNNLDFFTNSVNRIRIFGGGNVSIGTTTDAGYKLDVNGTARVSGTTNNLTITNQGGGTPSLLLEANRSGWYQSISIKGGTTVLSTKTLLLGQYDNGNALIFNQSAADIIFSTDSTERFRLKNSGNVLINTTTDAGFKLDVNGTARVQNQLTTTGSITATSAIARGVYMNQTLVAAANSDILVGLDIAPTFTNGSFTGVKNYSIRVPNGSQIATAGAASYSLYLAASETALNAPSGILQFQIANLNVGRFFSSGNLTLQNGGTFTDAGYRLDVNGTARVSGNCFLATSSGNVGIGTTSSSYKLTIAQDGYNLRLANTPNSQGYNIGRNVSDGILYFYGEQSGFNGYAFTGINGERMRVATSGNILINTTTDIASSKLTVESTTQGFLPPRMTTTQKNAISTPAAGLVVYDTTLNKLCLYTTTWETITSI